jgi:hypothetical protein
MFDVDRDGYLGKDEYEAYLQQTGSSGNWNGIHGYSPGEWDHKGWLDAVRQFGSGIGLGISEKKFLTTLYPGSGGFKPAEQDLATVQLARSQSLAAAQAPPAPQEPLETFSAYLALKVLSQLCMRLCHQGTQSAIRARHTPALCMRLPVQGLGDEFWLDCLQDPRSMNYGMPTLKTLENGVLLWEGFDPSTGARSPVEIPAWTM